MHANEDLDLDSDVVAAGPEIEADTGTVYTSEDMPEMTEFTAIRMYPEQAARILETNKFIEQRGIIPRRLEELRKKVNDKGFPRYHGGDVAVARLAPGCPSYMSANGEEVREILINGQHTCQVCVETGKSIPVTHKVFRVTRLNQLPCLFAQFDVPGGNRTASQMAKAYESQFPEGWTMKQIRNLASATDYARQTNDYFVESKGKDRRVFSTSPDTSLDERISAMLTPRFVGHVEWARKVCYESPNGVWLQRIPVSAAMIQCHMENPQKAEDFWDKVRTAANCVSACPELILRDRLMTLSTKGVTKTEGVKACEILRWCYVCWEDSLNGKPGRRLRSKPRGQKRKTKADFEQMVEVA